MFTNITASYNNGDVLIEAACLSTDTKPTDGIANGSTCIEMDTGKTYMFNEEDSEWEELPSSGGGGGGGGSSDFSTATATFIVQNSASATITNLLLVWGQVGERYWAYREEIPFTAGTSTLPLVDGYTSFGIVPDSGVVVTVSGNAEYHSEDKEIGVTGDCTITIS